MKGWKSLKLFVYMTIYLAIALKSSLQCSKLFILQLQISIKYTSKDQRKTHWYESYLHTYHGENF